MKTLFALLLSSALATPVVAETVGEKTGVNSTLGIAPTTEDFVKEAAISDMFEIESSKLAETRTKGPTHDFAAKMVTDHTKTTSELKPLAMKAKVEVPAKLEHVLKSMVVINLPKSVGKAPGASHVVPSRLAHRKHPCGACGVVYWRRKRF